MFKGQIFIILLFLFYGNNPVSAEDKKLKSVTLLLDSAVAETTAEGKITQFGEIVKFSKDTLHEKKIPFIEVYMPWLRLIRELDTTDNAIVVGLIRTPEREEKFLWLKPLKTINYKLYTRNTDEYKNLTQQEITNGKYTALCEKTSAQCDMLKVYGFPEANITSLSEPQNGTFERLILRGRFDFFVNQSQELYDNLKDVGHAKDSLISIADLSTVTAYMAASKKSFDRRYIKTLQEN